MAVGNKLKEVIFPVSRLFCPWQLKQCFVILLELILYLSIGWSSCCTQTDLFMLGHMRCPYLFLRYPFHDAIFHAQFTTTCPTKNLMFHCVSCSYGTSECIEDIQISFSMMCFLANIWREGQCLRKKETMRAVKSMNSLFNLTCRMTSSCYCIKSKTKTETWRNATEFPWELLWNKWWQHFL